MADDSSEDSNEGAQKSKILYYIIAAILIVACIVAGIILIVYFGFIAHKTHNETEHSFLPGKHPNARRDDDELNQLKDENIVIVTEKLLNFTEAYDYCNAMNPSKQLFFPNLAADEEALERKMNKLIPDVTSEKSENQFRKKCGGDFMLGIRKVLDKDWKTMDDDYVFGPLFYPKVFLANNDPSEQCLGITEDMGELVFHTIDCDDSEGWNRILCQSKCDNSSTGFCYNIYENKLRTDAGEAVQYCANLELPSSIATIKHKSVLIEVFKQIKRSIVDFDLIGIGHRLALHYESIKETPINYPTQQILYKPERNASHNCIGVTVETEFKWEPIECEKKHCFVCN